MSLPTPAQIRAGRALLGAHQKTLAWWAGQESRCTISAFEAGTRSISQESIKRYVEALEARGVEFIPGGVRFAGSPDAA